MSRVLSTSVQVMGEATPREVKSKLGIRLPTVRMAEVDDNSRPSSFLLDGMEFRGWIAPFGTGFGLSLVDGDLPAEMGAEHISSRLEEEGVEVGGVFDMKDTSDRNRFQRWATNRLVGGNSAPQAPRKPGLKARLDAIQAQMPNDRFIKSLQDNLKRRGGLTQNQINAITKIENQLAGPKDQALIDRINAVLAKSPNGNSFLESLRDQVANGRPLSKKQLEALADNEKNSGTRKTRRTRRPRQDGGQYINLSQFHTWDLYHQLNALAGGHVARALYGIPEMGSDEERIFILLAEVASSSHTQMNTLTRLSALRKILPHLGKHPLLKNLPVDIAKDILRKVIVDGQPWRDDVSML